jgi:hypothetical protein
VKVIGDGGGRREEGGGRAGRACGARVITLWGVEFWTLGLKMAAHSKFWLLAHGEPRSGLDRRPDAMPMSRLTRAEEEVNVLTEASGVPLILNAFLNSLQASDETREVRTGRHGS